MRQVERYAELKDAKRVLENEIAKLQEEINTLEPQLLDTFAEQGVNSIKTQSGFSVSLRRQVWARVLDRDRVRDVLESQGLGWLLTPNSSQLSAWLREQEKDGRSLPNEFSGVVEPFERFSLSVRKS